MKTAGLRANCPLPEGCTERARIDRKGGSCAKRKVVRDKCCLSAGPTAIAPRCLYRALEPTEGQESGPPTHDVGWPLSRVAYEIGRLKGKGLRQYLWNSKKNHKVHIRGTESLTFCKIENSTPQTAKRLDCRERFYPTDKILCGVCLQMENKALTGYKRKLCHDLPRSEKKPRVSNAEFYQSWEWMELRFNTLKHYGARCMLCRTTEGRIVVDHIKPRSKYPLLELDPENLQVLCDKCNRGKGNSDETDFRPAKPEPELAPEQMEHLKAILQ